VDSLVFIDTPPAFDPRLENVLFLAVAGRHRVRCIIGAKALQEHFGAQGRSQAELIAAFQRGRRDIKLAAMRKYASLGQPVAELVLLARDFAGGRSLDASLAKHLRLDRAER
jgi:hypothetical protein